MRRLLVVPVLLVTLWSAPVSLAQPPCSQPVTTGEHPLIRDCVVVARASVGIDECAECVCDVDGSGQIQISDGLRCLRYVVGSESTLACPACEETTTTTTLPGCASCDDVLTGKREYEELCPLAKLIYDDMVDCPRESCGCACNSPCLIEPWNCFPKCWPYYGSSPSECIRCLKDCGVSAQLCSEN